VNHPLRLFTTRLEELAWDSAIVGRPCHRLYIDECADNASGITQDRLGQEVAGLIAVSQTGMVSCRQRITDLPIIRQLLLAGFDIVDSLVTFQAELSLLTKHLLPAASRPVREASIHDLEALCAFRTQFTTGRFSFDPRLPPGTAEKVYGEWIVNALKGSRGSRVFLHENALGEVTGFIIVIVAHDQAKGSRGVIDLLGVSPVHRGQGIARLLLRKAVDTFALQGLMHATVGAHSDNPTAMALYQAVGFRMSAIDLSLHYWKDS
jgi:ribosomal protein S18 acetylase RimI-like enzyme